MFFFPLRDDNPTSTRPIISWILIALCVLVFMWQLSLGGAGGHAYRDAILAYGVTPAVLLGGGTLPPEIARIPTLLTIFTSMFMHGGFMHLGGNMLYLWIFGDNVEDSIGDKKKYIALYVICGIAAALSQAAIDPTSFVPMIGASGAIAGMLGAYLILHPRANVNCLIGIFIFFRTVNIPAFIVLGSWIGLQFLSLGQTDSGTNGGVAYVAHIGGFVAGMVLIPFFKRKDVPLFDQPQSVAFHVERLKNAPLHIPSMVRKQVPQPKKVTPKTKHHPWSD